MKSPTLILILSLFLSTSIQEKIYGGRNCHVGEFPSLVHIKVFNLPTCGGSILDKQHILTAAHCLIDIFSEKYTVIAGDIGTGASESTSRQVRSVSKLTKHPNFNLTIVKNDIGIITLTKPLELNELVRVAFLGTEFPKIDTKAIVAGWGETEDEPWSNICKTTVSTIYPKEKCIVKILTESSDRHEVWLMLIPIESQICAGDVTGKNATWYGDSGGPLYVMGSSQMELVGLTSHGDGERASITVFTYINYFKEWITAEMSKPTENNALKPAVRRDRNAVNQRKNSVNIQIFILQILASRMVLRFLS